MSRDVTPQQVQVALNIIATSGVDADLTKEANAVLSSFLAPPSQIQVVR